jgi:hypothetical protein
MKGNPAWSRGGSWHTRQDPASDCSSAATRSAIGFDCATAHELPGGTGGSKARGDDREVLALAGKSESGPQVGRRQEPRKGLSLGSTPRADARTRTEDRFITRDGQARETRVRASPCGHFPPQGSGFRGQARARRLTPLTTEPYPPRTPVSQTGRFRGAVGAPTSTSPRRCVTCSRLSQLARRAWLGRWPINETSR